MAVERLLRSIHSGYTQHIDDDRDNHDGSELQPLAAGGDVATYNSQSESQQDAVMVPHMTREKESDSGESGEAGEYVIVKNDTSEVASDDKLEGQSVNSPSDESSLDKTSHDTETSPCPSRYDHGIEWRSKGDMPVRMKGAQVTMHNSKLYIGGGYTGHKRTEMTIYEYDPNFDLWAELPISPMRWFGMTEYKGQLVLVGGKDTIANTHRMILTNRIAVFDDVTSKWSHPYPHKYAVCYHPVVFSHAHLLVVAGGHRGILDYRVEIFNGVEWYHGPNLPSPILPMTSLVHDNEWYIVAEDHLDSVYHVSLNTYLHDLLEEEDEDGERQGSERASERELLTKQEQEEMKEFEEKRDLRTGVEILQSEMDSDESKAILYGPMTPVIKMKITWNNFNVPPYLSTIQRLMFIGKYLMALPSLPSDGSLSSNIQVYLLVNDRWLVSGKLPPVAVSSSVYHLPNGELMLFGGDIDGLRYSNKVFKVTVGSTGTQRKRAVFSPHMIVM